jgi:hypothetical protein
METKQASSEFMMEPNLEVLKSSPKLVNSCVQVPMMSQNSPLTKKLVIISTEQTDMLPTMKGVKQRSKSTFAKQFEMSTKKRSSSMGSVILPAKSSNNNRKRRIHRHQRAKDNMELADMAEQMENYFSLYKRDPTQIFDDVDAVLYEEHKGNYLPSQREFLMKPRHKCTKQINVKSLTFKSIRGEYRIPLLIDENCLRVDKGHAKLRYLFKEGIYNEDNDTDESEREKGVERNFKTLQMELENRKGSRRLAIGQYGLNKRSQVATTTPASNYTGSESLERSESYRGADIRYKPGHKSGNYSGKEDCEDARALRSKYFQMSTGLKKLKGPLLNSTSSVGPSKVVDHHIKNLEEISRKHSTHDAETGIKQEVAGSPNSLINEARDSNSMEEETPDHKEQSEGVKNSSTISENNMHEETALTP